MAWQPVNDPAPMGFYADNQGKVKRFVETRWRHMQDSCEALEARIKKSTIKQSLFMDGSFLVFLGAEAEGDRQSDTLRVIFKDESWRYDPGANREIDNRKEAFNVTNDWKIVELGTGGIAGEEFAENHRNGTCEVYEVPCEHCGEFYEYKWDIRDGGVFRWEEITKEDGSLDFQKTKETVHIECPNCSGKIYHDRGKQRAAVIAGRWRATNPDADGTERSFTLPIFVPGADPRDFVEKWLKIGKGRDVGRRAALKGVIMFDLAEFWKDLPIVEKKDLPIGDYTREWMLNNKWDREVVRLATIDYQHGKDGEGEHFWFVVRAYAQNGDSRLADCGKIFEVTELNERILAAGVHKVNAQMHAFSPVAIDCAFKQGTVFEFCMRFMWTGIRGEDRDTKNNSGQFLHRVQQKKGGPIYKVWRNFSELKMGEVGVGKTTQFSGYAPWRSINNQGIEDMLFELRSGRALSWTVPSDIEEFCPEYAAHMQSHHRINVNYGKDGEQDRYRWVKVGSADDHLYDCEKYQVGKALEAELVSDMSETQEEE